MRNWWNKHEFEYSKNEYYWNRLKVMFAAMLMGILVVVYGMVYVESQNKHLVMAIGGILWVVSALLTILINRYPIIIQEISKTLDSGTKYVMYKVIKPKGLTEEYETLDDAIQCAEVELDPTKDPTKDWEEEP